MAVFSHIKSVTTLIEESTKQDLKCDVVSKKLLKMQATVNCSPDDRRLAVDQAFRDYTRGAVCSQGSVELLGKIVDLTISLATSSVLDTDEEGLCSATLPYLVLSDIFDLTPISKCESVFSLLEDRVQPLKTPELFTSGKSALLRMCNDLLRRLSKSQDTVFCGRIQMFFSRLFPLDDKSGLNLMSQFNGEYVNYASSAEGEIELETGISPSDKKFYLKFWSLQTFFRQSSLCYDSEKWKIFVENVTEVLDCFSSLKLDDVSVTKAKHDDSSRDQSEAKPFFARYLTSQGLLELQLVDSKFRRSLLLQILILFQYLNSSVRFRASDLILSDEQTSWITETRERIYQLLREIPPEADKVSEYVDHVLEREEFWSNWKNESCPSFIKTAHEDDSLLTTGRKRKANALVDRDGNKVYRFANPELNRLWRICPDNLDAAKDQKRLYAPDLRTFFTDAIEELDPEQKVDDEFKRINNEAWNWRALRLLSRKSSYFFQNQQLHSSSSGPTSAVPGRPLKDYLESILLSLGREFYDKERDDDVSTASEEAEQNVNGQEGEYDDRMNGEMTGAHENGDHGNKDFLSGQLILDMATALGDQWKKFGLELGVDSKKLDKIQSKSNSPDLALTRAFQEWMRGRSERDVTHCRVEILTALDKFKEKPEVANLLSDLLSS